MDFRIMVVFLDEPLAAHHHGRPCIWPHQDVRDHLNQGQLVRIVNQLAFEVGLVKVDGLVSAAFLLSVLLIFLVAVKNVAKSVTQLLF